MTPRAWLAATAVLLTEAGVAGSHATWDSTWWRTPLLWSDRWHLLSWLSHYPAIALILWLAVPRGPRWRNWLLLAAASAGVWWLVKLWAGREWAMWWVQAWHWIGG